MEFKDLKYGQMFTIAEDPGNVWGKIPLIKEPEDGDPETEEGMVNALLLNGDSEDAVLECFEETQECECLTLVFHDDDEDDDDSYVYHDDYCEDYPDDYPDRDDYIDKEDYPDNYFDD